MGVREADVASEVERLIRQLSAAEALLERAGMFGELGRGVSLWAAGNREQLVADVRWLCERVLGDVLTRVMAESRSRDTVRADAKQLAEGHLARCGQDTGKLQRLLRDLAEVHDAATELEHLAR